MNSVAALPPPEEESRPLAAQLHDLRTPLNQIIGFSEMLVEIAEEEGHADLVEGLCAMREAGVEIAALVQEQRLFRAANEPDGECRALADWTRSAISRVLGFADFVLAEPGPRLRGYHADFEKIRGAAQQFVAMARTSELCVGEDNPNRLEHLPPVGFPVVGGAAHAGHGRVLIVDDEALNREMLSRRLEREGYQPTGAADGREALAIMALEPFDAVLLDMQMPELSGIEVLRALKGDPRWRHLPVIMLSALTDVERVALCIELGAEDYLPKPVNSVLLRARLGACLEKKALRDQEQMHFQALHAEKERLAVTLRSIADAVVTTDVTGRILLFNEAAATLTGATSETAPGRPFEEIFPIFRLADQQPAGNLTGEVLARHVAIESEPGLAMRAADGTERLVSTRCAPIYDHTGQIEGTVVVVLDVTEKEKLASHWLRTNKLESLGVLAGGLAHDFNNMLTAVLGNLSLVRHRHNFPAELLPSIDEAERGAVRAQELTRYLLTFSDGGAPLKQRLQPHRLIEETARFAAQGAPVEMRFALAAELSDLEADPYQLAQVISNLVTNAIEASEPAGVVTVSAENVTAPLAAAPPLPAGAYLRLSVVDHGCGIPAEHLASVYDPFFTTKAQARGLGLATAYSIIRRHGGEIAIQSTPGDGTLVTLYIPSLGLPVSEPLPRAVAGSLEPSVPAENATPAPGEKLRVLVMDDEESIRLLIQTVLALRNYDVVTTASGEEALIAHSQARAAGRPFQVAIIDLTVPHGMGGKETIRRLREVDRELAAIVSSGYSNDPVMARYREYGFDAVLPKPYRTDALTACVQNLPIRGGFSQPAAGRG